MIKLKELRQERNLSLRELSSQLDIAYSSLGKYERGDQQPSFESLIKIADFFNVSTDYLIGHSECRLLTNQDIHSRIGLSDEAIFRLKQLKDLSKGNEIHKNLMKNINSLLGDYDSLIAISDYLDSNLESGQYAVCNYYISQNGEDLINPPKTIEKIFTNEQWSNVFISSVQECLSNLKKHL